MTSASHFADTFLPRFKKFLQNQLPSQLSEIYSYPVLPPGKLFRPLLAQMLFDDLQNSQTASKKYSSIQLDKVTSDLFYLQCFLEIHHAYTLVHDDLPDMDNDDYRRGRLTVHKQFGNWQAILSGDGLQTLSFRALSFLSPDILGPMLKIASWACGPKGLIQGQVMDLSGDMKKNFSLVRRTHELKTARLFQVSLLGATLIHHRNISFENWKRALRLGQHLGLAFQLIDDWHDFKESAGPNHEADINPFILFATDSQKTLEHSQKVISSIYATNEYPRLMAFTNSYMEKSAPKN